MNLDELIAALRELQASTLPEQLKNADLKAGLEPMTALTDAILAAWTSFLAAFLLARANGRRPVVLWGWGFIAAAVSALAGVAYHGARIHFGYTGTVLSWKLVPVSTGVAAVCLGVAAAMVWLGPATRRIVVTILVVKFVAFLGWAMVSNSFLVPALDYGTVLVFILFLALHYYRQRAARFVAAGIVVSFIAVGVQSSDLTLIGLDHNDIFHVIQMIGMYLLYRGGALLEATT